MKTVIAVHKIRTSDLDAEMTHTGHYDAEGNAILKKRMKTIMPGESFQPRSEEELAQLLEAGAIRLPTETEELIRGHKER